MASPTTLLIARHGEAHCNVDQIIGGPTGCRGLTDQGHTQVRRLADRLRRGQRRHPIQNIYASPLPRTRQSAEAIAQELGVGLTIIGDLREQDYGVADSLPWAAAVNRFGGIPVLEPDRALASGGETWRQYLHRSARALANILAEHQGDHVLIVGHGETIDTAFRLFLDLPATSRGQAGFAAYPASLTHWQQVPTSWTQPGQGQRWLLVSHNDTRHLEDRHADGDDNGAGRADSAGRQPSKAGDTRTAEHGQTCDWVPQCGEPARHRVQSLTRPGLLLHVCDLHLQAVRQQGYRRYGAADAYREVHR